MTTAGPEAIVEVQDDAGAKVADASVTLDVSDAAGKQVASVQVPIGTDGIYRTTNLNAGTSSTCERSHISCSTVPASSAPTSSTVTSIQGFRLFIPSLRAGIRSAP